MESFLLTSKLALRTIDASSSPSAKALKSSPMVAFAKLSSLSGKHNSIGLGDFQHGLESDLVYEELTREKNVFQRSDYTFTAAAGNSTERRKYVWVKDMKGKLSTSYECVGGGGRVVARMYSGGALNWKDAGRIEIADSVEKGLEELLIVGGLSIWAIEGILGWSLAQADKKDEQKAVEGDHSHTA